MDTECSARGRDWFCSALCPRATPRRAGERAVPLPLCSGFVSRSDRLKAVFSDKWGYELDSLPRHRGRSSSKLVKLFVCCLNSSRPAPQVPWPDSAFGFALKTIASVRSSLGLRAAGPRSFRRSRHFFWPDGASRLSTAGGATFQPQCLGKRGGGRSGLFSISQTGSLVGRGQELPSALALNESPASAQHGEPPCLLLALLCVISSTCCL